MMTINRVSFLNFIQTAENTVTMKLPPVEVLNQLGKLGYRIIGTSMDAGVNNKMVWTLEQPSKSLGCFFSFLPFPPIVLTM